MSLIFGNLVQDFVTFGLAENNYYQSLQSNDANVIEQAQMALDTAASEFRHNASLDASYLTYFGMFLNLPQCIYLNSYQVSRCSFAHICTCAPGPIHQRSMGKEYERGIFRLS